MLTGALGRGADALIVDLEDSVAPSHKDEAREIVAGWLSDLPANSPLPEIWIRVNHGPDGVPWGDMALVRLGPVTGITLPKTESPEQVENVGRQASGGVIPLIESARGMLCADAVGRAPQVTRLALGEADLAADLGCEPSPDVLHPLRMSIVVSSAAAGLPRPIGPVSTDFNDMEDFRRSNRELKRIGFGARSAIHPVQVGPINEVFAPDPNEIEAARRVVREADEAQAAGSGVFLAEDGRMVDAAVVRRARRLLDESEAGTEGDRH